MKLGFKGVHVHFLWTCFPDVCRSAVVNLHKLAKIVISFTEPRKILLNRHYYLGQIMIRVETVQSAHMYFTSIS